MLRISCLAATVLIAGSALAQTNQIGIYPETTTFTSRTGIPGASDGDILLQVRADAFSGIGNPAGTVDGLRFVLQDQDLSTQDSFNVVVLADDGTGLPDITAGNEISRSSNLQLAAGAPGPAAFFVTTSFATPAAVPQTASFYPGVGVGSNGAWTADGLSVHAAAYTGTGNIANVTNPNAPGLTFTVDTTNGAIVGNASTRVHRIYMLTTGAALEAGADVDPAAQGGAANPNLGPRGYYQDRSLNDGVATRVRDVASANAFYAVIGQITGANPSPFTLPGIQGTIFLEPTLLFPTLLASGNLDATGEAVTVFVGFPLVLSSPFTSVGGVGAQAIVDVGGANRMSNFVVMQDN